MLLYPVHHAAIALFGSRLIFKNTDRRHQVIVSIYDIVCVKAGEITDNRENSIIDPPREFLSRTWLCFSLPYCHIHGASLHPGYILSAPTVALIPPPPYRFQHCVRSFISGSFSAIRRQFNIIIREYCWTNQIIALAFRALKITTRLVLL